MFVIYQKLLQALGGTVYLQLPTTHIKYMLFNQAFTSDDVDDNFIVNVHIKYKYGWVSLQRHAPADSVNDIV